MSFQTGDKVGDYEIIGVLGAGGMGRVYKVKNLISDRVDAMKVLLPDLADEADLADRFVREIKVLASLNHPNIAGLRTAFRLENQLLMIMEFVEGTTFEDKLKGGPLSVPDAIDYASQVLSALGYAHSQGVVHRDIKPANMMLTPENVVKLMDFGIAKSKVDRKLTMTGTTLGSLYYMPPEQVQGLVLDPRSDLYSFGVSLYEMVTGSRPFKGQSDYDLMVAHLQRVPLPPIDIQPELPKALNDIIMTALEKDPEKRFQSAEAFRFALQGATSGLSSLPVASAPAVVPVLAGELASTSVAPSPTEVLGAPPGQSTGTELPSTPPYPVSAPPVQAQAIQPPPTSRSLRGLFIILAALIVIAGIALGAMKLPRLLKARGQEAERAAQRQATGTEPTTPQGGEAGALAAPALTAAPQDHNLPSETAQATVPTPPNPSALAKPAAQVASRPNASPALDVTADAAKSLPAPPPLTQSEASATTISHPSKLWLDPAGRLFLVLRSISRKPDGSFQFRGILLLPVAQPGRVPLDRGAEVVGTGTVSQGLTSLAVSEFEVQGARYVLKGGNGAMRAETPGAGGGVHFDRSQLLDMWPTASAVYERVSDQTGNPEPQK
jgi:serine/threonine-protein kinase